MWQKAAYGFIIMLISPIFGLFQGLQGDYSKLKRITLIVFTTLYGSIIYLPNGSDGRVHQANVNEYYSSVSFPRFLLDCGDILTMSANLNVQEDLYIHFVSYLTGGILGMPGLFFVVVAFVYGYFYSGSLFKLVKLLPGFKYSWVFYGFLTVFVMWKGLESMNTVRTWTGMWVLFYGCISYYQTKNPKYFLLIFIPQYIHVGYFAMALPAWGVIFAGVRPKVYIALFFLSFGANLIKPQVMTEQIEQTDVGKEQIRGYSVEEERTATQKFEMQNEKGANFYRAILKSGIQYYIVSFIAVFLILRGYFPNRMTYMELHLFSIGILTRVLSSATWFHYALSNRSSYISVTFMLAAFISLAQRGGLLDKDGKYPIIEKVFFTLCFIGLIPTILFKLSEYTYFVSIFMLSTPFIGWFFPDVNMSIKELINLLF